MLFGYLTLATALILSLSAAVYSILGLTAIFAAAFWPIVVLGGSLEIGKIITTLWLHKYWKQAELQYKVYLCSAVAILMLLTSMGVFGFLSKAHLDQAIPSGDVQAQVQIFDDKIKTQKDNIEAARKALSQMDAAVDQTMSRSSSEQGADKAASLRRSQGRERTALQNDISKAQKEITGLQEQRAPIASAARKVEAEVGPIKYIAALIYGDNPEANVLEKAVRWVIILIVIVFDPLALTLLLAATKTFEWEHNINLFNINKKKEDQEQLGEWTEEDIDAVNNELLDGNPSTFTTEYEELEPVVSDPVELPTEELVEETEDDVGDAPVIEEKEDIPLEEELDTIDEEYPFRGKGIQTSMPLTASYIQPVIEDEIINEVSTLIAEETLDETEIAKTYVNSNTTVKNDIAPYGTEMHQHAMTVWKTMNPGATFIEHIDKLKAGEISELPWEHPDHAELLPISDREKMDLMAQPDNEPNIGEVRGFGSEFPKTVNKGDMFLRVDSLPSQLFKFNGQQWIRVNKNLSDSYIYDDEYISHLIEKVGSGEYDPDLLSDAEKERIAETLRNEPEQG